MQITKRMARDALGTNDAGLAAYFRVTPGAVSQWDDSEPLPELRQLQLRHRRPDIRWPEQTQATPRRIDTPEAAAAALGVARAEPLLVDDDQDDALQPGELDPPGLDPDDPNYDPDADRVGPAEETA